MSYKRAFFLQSNEKFKPEGIPSGPDVRSNEASTVIRTYGYTACSHQTGRGISDKVWRKDTTTSALDLPADITLRYRPSAIGQ